MIYSALIFILDFFLQVYGIFSPKISKWNLERNHQKKGRDSKKKITDLHEGKRVVWMHCASLGEFEQGRVIIESIKKYNSEVYILLSFFSPSGYEVRKNYEFADEVVYLPLDYTSRMASFIDYYNPSVFIGIKYEWWWNLFTVLNKKNIPKVLIALKPKQSSYIFYSMFTKFRNLLIDNSFLYCQDQVTFELFSKYSTEVFLSGDPRVESVLQRKSNFSLAFKRIQSFIKGRNVIIYGSVYQEDMKVLCSSIDHLRDYFHIIVPHDVSKGNCQKISSYFSEKLLYWSTFGEANNSNKILIDQIGLLFDLYRLGDAVYIGGGFGRSIHNTLEPAVFDLPIAIGPKHKGFAEVDYWLEQDSIFVVSVKEDFDQFIELSNNEAWRKKIVASQQAYFEMNEGVCEPIVSKVNSIIS